MLSTNSCPDRLGSADIIDKCLIYSMVWMGKEKCCFYCFLAIFTIFLSIRTFLALNINIKKKNNNQIELSVKFGDSFLFIYIEWLPFIVNRSFFNKKIFMFLKV